jgi:two-component system, NtrC family, sensor histidine kinase HydH
MQPIGNAEPINLTRRFAIASFGVITVIALGLAWLMSTTLTERLLMREGGVTQDFMQNLLLTDDSAQFFVDPHNLEFVERFSRSMAHIENMKEPVRVNAYRADGTVLWSTDKSLVGRQFPVNDELQDALRGQLVVHTGNARPGLPDKEEHEGLALYGSYYVESYIPIYLASGGAAVGVMEFYKISTQLNESIHQGVLRLLLACLASALVLFASLYWIVARADRLMRQQHRLLSEAQTLATAVELASAVAHNLRNPLASIRVSAEMQQQSDAQTTDFLEHSQDITQAVDRADRWISELVRVAQAPNLTPESVPIAALMKDCFEEMQVELSRRNIQVFKDNGADLQVVAHPAMLRQIVLSIIANALDAMARGGQLTVRWQQVGVQGVLTLADTGTGISPDISQQVFRPFFSTKSGGLGIGLALVKRMVEQWQGSIKLHPVLPHGTSVEIRLPIAH